MNGCQDARNAITISEIACPQCGESLEIFVKDGKVCADAQCEGCGWKLVEGTPADELPCG